MNSFDDKFTKKVKETFDNYNANHLVDAGWEAFRAKQGKSSKSIFLIPLWAKAATITLLMSLGGYFTFRVTDKTSIPVITEEIKTVESKPVEQQEPVKVLKEIIPEESKNQSKSYVTNRKVTPTQVIEPKEEAVISEIIPQHTVTTADSSFLSETETVYIANAETPLFDSTSVEVDSANVFNAAKKEAKPLVAQKLNIPEEDEVVKSKTQFSAGLSGMMASVESMISSSPGVAIGLYAEHKLTSRISIRPGLAIAQQTFTSGNSLDNLAYDAPNIDGAEGEVVEMESGFNFTVMEIPVNFVINVFERHKKSLFVSVGSSTMVYLNQHFTGTAYNSHTNNVFNNATGEWELNTTYSQSTFDSNYKAFSHTDFFGLANISAGYTFPLGEKSSMCVEPFIQIPVSKLTSTNLTMGFGGVSVKYLLNK